MRRSTTNFDFLKSKIINNSKTNNEDPPMPTSNVDVSISKKILKQNLKKTKSMKLIPVI